MTADLTRLVQCVSNILANAIKYTEPGGEIWIRTRGEGASAAIEIADTGAGMAPELLSRVFDLFVQSERTLDRSQGGLGIGLAVVKRLVQMHGGEIRARSAGLGQGSTFEIRLPRSERPNAAAAADVSCKAARRRVLIVDDNADSANSLAMLLSFHGHETRVAYSGKEALARLAIFEPEVGLIDIGLPEMDGYELVRRLRTVPALNSVRLIALTGYGQAEDRQRARAAGFDDHMVKPVSVPALERALAGMSGKEPEGSGG